MKTLLLPFAESSPLRAAAMGFVFALAALAGSASAIQAKSAERAAYKSAQEAVDALVAAVKAGDTDGIVAVLGTEGRALASSGDSVADKAARERFTSAYSEAHDLQVGADRAELIIGKDEYPFPIPVVAKDGAWRFDTAAGVEEILNRRIGANELADVGVVHAYVDAQREYAAANPDGKGPQYAQQLISSDGKKNGLYWPTADGEAESPLGPLVANARTEGYSRKRGSDAPAPYHGYVFRILTSQGKGSAGGARDYIYNGRMIGGFGLVAAPAEYGNSGVMTFVVNQDGTIYEKDFGPSTPQIAARMTSFNPDSEWTAFSSD